ncbi:MAG: carboxypeptidase-like regulatory domain-containing protein [Agriterribacter sp.]
MGRILLFVIFLSSISGALTAQNNIKNARQQSWQKFVYRISSDTAEKYVDEGIASPDYYLDKQPFVVWHTDSAQYEALPTGNYIIIGVNDNELTAQYYCSSNLRVFPINNQHRVQLEIKDSVGQLVTDAMVWMNKRAVLYNSISNAFVIHKKKFEEATLKIAIPGDTLFLSLSAMDEMEQSSWTQWWNNWTYTKLGRIVSFPYRKIKMMATTPSDYWFRKAKKIYRNGYMVFNKPKYMPLDTVKLKAYILNKRGNQYKNSLDIYLQYYLKNAWAEKQLANVKPVTKGDYLYEFLLGDSLESDKTYTIVFKNKRGKEVMRGSFAIEDYLLDEVSTYTVRSEKEHYYSNDSLCFYANATDANGLSLLDGKVNFYLVTQTIDQFYKERLFVADTLWKETKSLAVQGDTKFVIPAGVLPNADLSIEAVAEFRNSNNELQTKQVSFEYISESKTIKVWQEGAYIVADYLENGIRLAKEGYLVDDENKPERKMHFPFREKLNPYFSNYNFSIKDSTGKKIIKEDYEVEKNYRLSFGRIQDRDTSGFTLYNPYAIPVHYAVFDGNKMIGAGTDTSTLINWKRILPEKRIFNVEWNYIWADEEQKGNRTIALLDKILHTTITSNEVVYPGQTDTITVSVADYKDRPVKNMNLTAVSYNSQFKNAIRVPEPPYLQRFRGKRRILFDKYEMDDVSFTDQFVLGKHQQWRKKFGLDTMLYYRFLFPDTAYLYASMFTNEIIPQVSVHVVQKGVPQEIYMLYINRDFVWYNGATDKSNYAFEAQPGYAQIAFRLKDKYVEIDSIYLQPFYKHDIVFDLDRLPSNAFQEPRPEYYTSPEKDLLERHLLKLQDDNRTNNGYIWQNSRLVYLDIAKPHIVGPFNTTDSLQFFKPGGFDLKFMLERGYEYRLSSKMARLEPRLLFPAIEPALLPKVEKTKWILGDTIVAHPLIQYNEKITKRSFLPVNDNDWKSFNDGTGKLSFTIQRDSSFEYAILHTSAKDTSITRVKQYSLKGFQHLLPGNYTLILVTKHGYFLQVNNIEIKENGTTCVRVIDTVYTSNNLLMDELIELNEKKSNIPDAAPSTRDGHIKITSPSLLSGLPMPKGNASVSGVLKDAKGKAPIQGATVMIKGYRRGTLTNADGYFKLDSIMPGDYVIVFASVGYELKEYAVHVEDNANQIIDAALKMSENHLSDVVVTGYGTTRSKRSLAYAISTVKEEVITTLQGKAAGIIITDAPGSNVSVRIRGASTLMIDAKPMYVVNGVMMDELPQGLDTANMKISILKGEVAIQLYGERAAAGVILINSEDFMPNTVRSTFRDYAFWQPNLFTDDNGKVKFAVKYPDNITSWQTYVIGMDKKRRITKSTTLVKSLKPVLAQLSSPSFLIEGDTAMAVGKVANRSAAQVTLQTSFAVNDKVIKQDQKNVQPNEALTEALPVSASCSDSLNIQYTIHAENGYGDGELRKIPVFKKGITETKGMFWVFDKDSTIVFRPDPNAGKVVLYAQNNTLDLLLDELDLLKKYPYFCMEQTASKLKGLLMEKQVRKALHQSFNEEKDIAKLLNKIQKAQHFDGSWSWWQNGESNVAITNYVTQALLLLKQDVLVQINIRNATLYLQQRIPYLNKRELLPVLFTLSEAGHQMDYQAVLQQFSFDSLSIHQQWQCIKILQKQQLSYQKKLEHVMSQKREGFLGSLYWGDDSYWWESNEIATTVLAYTVLEQEEKYRPLLKNIIQFFLERRTNGRWRNTVESASIVSAILPEILRQNALSSTKGILTIKTNTTDAVDSFPYKKTIAITDQPITISKSGGGIQYVTAWQQIFNTQPQAVTDKFQINTSFQKSGKTLVSLTAGEKTTLKTTIKVLKDADYVQLQIPIPAGCTYAEKNQDIWNMHKEFLKDKLIIFVEHMNKGDYDFEVELEPRYTGSYHLNPAKAELMYFPTFYGRNEMKRVEIK